MVPPDMWAGWNSVCPPKVVPEDWVNSMLEYTTNFSGKPFEKFRGMYQCDSLKLDVQEEMKIFAKSYAEREKARFSGAFPLDFGV